MPELLPAKPKLHFLRAVWDRRGHEVELYRHLGFPDFFTNLSTDSQCLTFYGHQVMLKGSLVIGDEHNKVAWDVPWDGVLRPQTYREYRVRVQELSPLVGPDSLLAKALSKIRLEHCDALSWRWRALVDWWALSRQGAEEGLQRDLDAALRRMGDRETLRLAAELISPTFARDVLVESGHWPPSSTPISPERFLSAVPAEWPNSYRVVCVETGDDLGRVDTMRSYNHHLVVKECELFAEPYRATSAYLGRVRCALTGDGEVWHREQRVWRRLGPPEKVLVARPQR